MTYDPDRSDIPYDGSPAGEVQMAKWTEPSPVKVGDHVMYRADSHGDVTDAVVLHVRKGELEGYPSEAVHPSGVLAELPPWPLLTLDTVRGPVKTREARVRGSAGWLPLGWHA